MTVPVTPVVLVTLICPVVAPAGTVALSCVAETWVIVVAAVAFNFTVEVLLYPTPLIVTTVPAGPPPGLKLVIDRLGVKFVALVPVPAGVVTLIVPGTAPLGTVALSCEVDTNVIDGAARAPNFTVALCTKLVPLIVTVLPVIPDAGVNEATVGAAAA